tara:strand:- start:903 stop:2039 length:1137 start_codon:yes stop_codon:yes gene_type:complete
MFIFLAMKDENYHIFKKRFFIFFTIFWIYLVLNSIVSQFPLFSLKSSIVYFRFGLFVLATLYLLENKKNFILNFTLSFLAAYCFALIDGYYQYLFSTSIFGFESENLVRLNLPLNDDLLLGNYLARLFPILFGLIIYQFSEKKLYIYLISILLILTDILVFLSGERTALGLLFLFTILIILFLSKFKIIRIITFIISLLAITFIATNNYDIKKRNVDTTISQLGMDSKSDRINLFSPGHESHFMGAWNMFKHNTILGVGVNNFRNLCDNEKYKYNKSTCSTHPHNTLVQIASELGSIGLLFYLLIIIYICYKILLHIISFIYHKKLILNDYQLSLIFAIILSLWPLIPSLNFFHNWINIIYYLPIGFLLYSSKMIEVN